MVLSFVNLGPKLPNSFAPKVSYWSMNDVASTAFASVGLEGLKVLQAERTDIDISGDVAKRHRIVDP